VVAISVTTAIVVVTAISTTTTTTTAITVFFIAIVHTTVVVFVQLFVVDRSQGLRLHSVGCLHLGSPGPGLRTCRGFRCKDGSSCFSEYFWAV